MTKNKNVKNQSQEGRIKSPRPSYSAEEKTVSSQRKRKLIPPVKPSRIPEEVIIKAIEEVMAHRLSH